MTSRIHTNAMTAAIILLAMSSSSLLHAGTTHYRWINERGYPVHSDRPPPKGIDYEVVSTGSGLKRVVSAEEGAVPAEVKPRVGNEFDQVNESEERGKKKNSELCRRAQTNLETLSNEVEIKVRDDEGEERFLSKEEIIIEREKAKAQISVYCP